MTVSGAAGSSTGTTTGGNAINCAISTNGSASGSCTESRNPGTVVTLTATPATNAAVSWTNCPGSSGKTCSVTLDSDRTVTASFNTIACQNPVVRIKGSPVYYSSIQTAYDAAADGDLIQVMAEELAGDLSLNRVITITFDGGYDCSYSTRSGVTTLKGTLTINAGTVVVNNLRVE